eukprot:gene2155-4193_t
MSPLQLLQYAQLSNYLGGGGHMTKSISSVTEDSEIAAEIFSYLSLSDLASISSADRSLREACAHPRAWGRANFTPLKHGKGFFFWRHLNSKKALLEELNIHIGLNEAEIVVSLLVGCSTAVLKSVKIWMKTSRLYICPYHLSRVGQKRVIPIAMISGEKKNNLSGWVHWFLQEMDSSYVSHSQESMSICSVLAARCSGSLTSLRLPGSLLEVKSAAQLRLLQTLHVGGGDPSAVLDVVSALPCLSEFVWSHGREDFSGGPWLAGHYVLRSASLESVDVSLTHKFFHLSDVICPKLRRFRRKAGWYGNGLLEGATVMCMLQWTSCVLYTSPLGSLARLRAAHIDPCAFYGRWEQPTPLKFLPLNSETDEDDLFTEIERCTMISKIHLPPTCDVISEW